MSFDNVLFVSWKYYQVLSFMFVATTQQRGDMDLKLFFCPNNWLTNLFGSKSVISIVVI